MKWSYRKSLKLGPIRLNISKSGIGGSIGVPGIRSGIDAKGRSYSQLSIPGTGISSRSYSKKGRQASSFGSVDNTSYNPWSATPQRKGKGGHPIFNAICLIILLSLWGMSGSFVFAAALAGIVFVVGWSVIIQSTGSVSPSEDSSSKKPSEPGLPKGVNDAFDAFEKAYEEDRLEDAFKAYQNVRKDYRDLFLNMNFTQLMNVLLNDQRHWEYGENLCRSRLIEYPDSYNATLWCALFQGHQQKLDQVNEKLQPLLKSKTQEVMEIKHMVEYTYALCLLKCGREQEALRYFKAADKRYPGYSDTASYIEQLSKSSSRKRSRSTSEPKEKDPFSILGISQTNDKSAIEQAYRKMIAQYHPDKVATLGEELQKLALEKSKEINWAYEECLKRMEAA